MGNAKSKNSPYAGHEKLNENDERYFAKVQARNSTTRPSRRRFGRRRPGSAIMGCVTALTSSDPPRERDYDALSSPNQSTTLTSLNAKPFQQVAGPLKVNTMAKPESSPISVRLPSPRNETSRLGGARNSLHRTPSQRRLEKARSNQIRPTDSASPSDTVSITSSLSSSQPVIQDYYTDMLDEAHRESQQASAEGKRDSNRTFDSMLPSGMVWAEVSRGGKVTCVAFSRSNTTDVDQPLLMAIGADNGTIVIMEILDTPSSPLHRQIDFGSNAPKKTRLVKEFPRESTVRSLDFSPDGRWLVVGGDDCIACLMRLQLSAVTGSKNALDSVEMAQELEREDRVYCVQFSPDGSMLAVGGFDGMIAIVSVAQLDGTQELSSSLPTHPLALVTEIAWPRLVLSLDWSPDGSMLAVGGSGKCCSVLNSSWQIVADIHRSASVATVKWNPAGSHVAVGCSDGTVVVVHVDSQTIAGEIVRGVPRVIANGQDETRSGSSSSQVGGSCHVSSLCWSPDGDFLAIGGSDDCCAIVETNSFALVHETRRSGHVTCLAWKQRRQLTGDEARYLVIGGEDRAVAIMKTGVANVDRGEISDAESDDFYSVASSSYFSVGSLSQHEWILREDSFRDIDDCDSFSLQPSPSSPLDDAPRDAIITAALFSRHKKGISSHYMTIARSDGGVTIMNTQDWHIVKQLTFSNSINTVHFSRKSDLLALGGEAGTVYVVSVSNWQIVKEIKVTSTSIRAVQFSRSDERLAVGCSDGVLTLLNPADGWKIMGEIDASDSSVSCIDWSSKHLALGRDDGTVSVHEAARVYANFFLPEAELTRGNVVVHSVAFGVSGRFLAVGDASGKVGIFSAKGGWVLCHQINTPTAVLRVRWSSEGRYLAFGGKHQDLGARVVDTVTWTNVKELQKLDHREELLSLDWSNDDKWLVVACSNGSSHIIDTTDWKIQSTVARLGMTPSTHLHPKGAISASGKASNAASAQSSASSDTERAKDEYTDVLEGKLSWGEMPHIARFLAMSEAFLEVHREVDPSPTLRPFLTCVIMLTIHVKWICAKDGAVSQRVSQTDDGEPAVALLRILRVCADVMKRALQQKDTAIDAGVYSTRFGLGQRDLRRIQAWNDQWLVVDLKAPCVDTALLEAADKVQ